jgi:hypothetical protein
MLDAIDDHFPGGLGGFLLAICGALLILGLYAMAQESKQWEAFKVAHDCKVVAKMRGSSQVAPGFSGSGNVTFTVITEPDKTGWLCNDGVTYYR